MDFQTVLAVNLMAVSALSLLIGLLQRRRELRSFAAVNGLVLAMGAFGLWRFPQEAGSLVALIFAPLIAAPMTLGAAQSRLTRAGRMEAAARCADLIALFHPTPAARLSAALARASAIEDPAERARTFAALAAQAPAEEAAAIETRLLADRGDWEKALVLAQNPESARQLAGYRLRALGETGRIEALMRDFARSVDSTPIEQTAFSWLFVLAFGGRPMETEALAKTVMRFDSDTTDYWVAVAQRHAGNLHEARATFERLAVGLKETAGRIAARRQLATDCDAAAAALAARARHRRGRRHAGRVGKRKASSGWRLPPATLSLILLLSTPAFSSPKSCSAVRRTRRP